MQRIGIGCSLRNSDQKLVMAEIDKLISEGRMLFRQRAILGLIHASTSIIPLRLWKLAFLLAKEGNASPNEVYDFVPHKDGPYSFTMRHDLKFLEDEGIISLCKDGYRTDSDEFLRCSIDARMGIARLVRRFQNVNTPDLVESVHHSYPDYTVASTDADKPMEERPLGCPAIYTIGYEGLTVEKFLDVLLLRGIVRLVDVRANPISRKFGFSGEILHCFCGDVGIEYQSIPQLGVRSSIRRQLSKELTYQSFFQLYRQSVTHNLSSIDRAASYAREKATAFMCKELNRNECHRQELGKMLTEKTGLPVIELSECGPRPKQLDLCLR